MSNEKKKIKNGVTYTPNGKKSLVKFLNHKTPYAKGDVVVIDQPLAGIYSDFRIVEIVEKTFTKKKESN